MEYTELYGRLNYELASVTFLKKDGSIRNMLCTRNIQIASVVYSYLGYELGGHDSRCNIKNGNIAVIDMVLGEARSFNISRVIDVHFFGTIHSMDEYNKALSEYVEFKERYEGEMSKSVEADPLGSIAGDEAKIDDTREKTEQGQGQGQEQEQEQEIGGVNIDDIFGLGANIPVLNRDIASALVVQNLPGEQRVYRQLKEREQTDAGFDTEHFR